jgi:hypothetical protein
MFLIAFSAATLLGSVNANAAVLTWTLSDLSFDLDGFQSQHIDGAFDYDQSTNMFSNVNLSWRNDYSCCWTVGITTATSTASALDIFSAGIGGGHISLASPLTDAGGVIAVASGSLNGWMLRSDQSISAPVSSAVPEPASWALMIGGFALVGAATRSRNNATRARLA